MGGGTWVIGTVNDQYKFNALVFAEHAESEAYELGQEQDLETLDPTNR